MKKSRIILLAASITACLVLASWQTGRYAGLASETRKLQAAQEEWLRENKKLAAGIKVLSSRERTAALAKELGLEKSSAERRLRIVAPSEGEGRSDG
ncbi:MAG: cell division protein FtsL [Spirochaetaceae bacterium]|nr:cell division protein FtsL [Spirochaetaceae bacterium]